MVSYKHSSKIIIALMAAAVLLCFLAVAFSGKITEWLGGKSVRMEYESALFDTDKIISVEIEMDQEEWDSMLQNPLSEEYYVCNVVINGQRINNVAIRPKGNTSLSAIAMDPDSDRYSLKLEFDHFVKGQTCFGLDKLILNNNYADATNMKEAVIYDMYQYIGADASLYNYAKVSVNGEYWGVYLALEAVEQSFMLRNFGTQDGELYKPDSMEMGGSNSSSEGGKGAPGGDFNPGSFNFGDFNPGEYGDFDPGEFDPGAFEGQTPPDGGFSFDRDERPDPGNFDPSDRGGGSRSGNGGANLNYTDDDLDSYSLIWDGEVTGTSKGDHRRVVTALKNISEGTDLETYLDVDNVLKYMAVHTFAVNMDSLSGSMSHNYYLYEYNGQLNIFPWDYNLSFGGMSIDSSGDGTSMINDAIDTPFSGTQFFDALLENEEYLERYHAYLQQLVDEYVNGGRFDEVYQRIRTQIDTLVETDPTAFYSAEEYENAAEILCETVKLRAESIEGQLAGTIPSTDAGQRQNSSALVDGSHLNIQAMGQFNMGGFGGRSDDADSDGSERKWPSSEQRGGRKDSGQKSGSDSGSPGRPDTGSMPSGGFPENFDPGNLPEDFDPDQLPGGFGFGSGDSSWPSSFPGGMPGQSAGSTKVKNLIIYAICFAGMIAALFIVSSIRRRK